MNADTVAASIASLMWWQLDVRTDWSIGLLSETTRQSKAAVAGALAVLLKRGMIEQHRARWRLTAFGVSSLDASAPDPDELERELGQPLPPGSRERLLRARRSATEDGT